MGTTSQGFEIFFDVAGGTGRGAIGHFSFEATVDCVRDEGSPGTHTFTQTYQGGIAEGRVDGSTFEATDGPNHVSGRFEGKTATGVLSVTNYRDDLELAYCSTPGEIPFTARFDE
jgi:hypothetical protein